MEWTIPPDILAFYRQGAEPARLHSGTSQLEFARTQEVVTRWLDCSEAIVLDVGGGPGAYADWLAKLGHEVHLIDPVPEHVAHALSMRNRGGREIASCKIGDARSLDRSDQSADVVLLLGPLYHLVDAGIRTVDSGNERTPPGRCATRSGIAGSRRARIKKIVYNYNVTTGL